MYDVTPIISPKPLDCGPTCLRMLLLYYGIDVPLDTLIEECGMTVSGCTGADLLRVGRLHGLDMTAWRMDADEVLKQDRPAIVHWKSNHWVVCCGVRDEDGKAVICNPDLGRLGLTPQTFETFFTGKVDGSGQGVVIYAGEPKDIDDRPIATANHAAGEYFEEGGQLWLALVAIARGERIIEGANAVRIALTSVINELKSEE